MLSEKKSGGLFLGHFFGPDRTIIKIVGNHCSACIQMFIRVAHKD